MASSEGHAEESVKVVDALPQAEVLLDAGIPLQITLAVLVSGWAHVLHATFKPCTLHAPVAARALARALALALALAPD